MIIKPLKPSTLLLQTEALNIRLPMLHSQKEKVASNAGTLRAGYNGEFSLQFPLSFLPRNKYLIFYNLRIRDSHGFFQIDILLLSTNFILIIEVKNIRDHVIFDDMGQAIRMDNEREQVFINPVNQINLQHLRLLHWLRQFDLPSIPIEKIVVYSNPNTILKNLTQKNEISEIVMHKENTLEKVDEFSSKHSISKFSEDQLLELTFQLLLADTQDGLDILKKYEVSYEELIKGVQCPKCFTAPMKREYGKWRCANCGEFSKTAHKTALSDYALLINNYISNSKARIFLQLPSPNIMKRLLQKENLEHYGVKSGRKYRLNVSDLT